MIELQGVEFVAGTVEGNVRVLHPTTLSLSERRIALIGANGSGKSTLARLLNGLIEPSAGFVSVRAEDAESATDTARWLDTRKEGAAIRRLVGFVFTDPSSQLVMPTALEDVTLSLRRQHTRKAERVEAARAALRRLGLEDLADRSVHSLSGGQQQLLAIAGVLAARPAIIVADEPTTLLDLRNGHLISDLLLGLPQQVIIATHDLDLAARCDRVIVIANGAVAFDSSTQADPGSTWCTPTDAIAWYREHA